MSTWKCCKVTGMLGLFFPTCSQVKMVDGNGKAVANETVYLLPGSLNLALTTDSRGVASFSLDTALWTDRMNLMVSRGFCSEESIRFLLTTQILLSIIHQTVNVGNHQSAM